MTTHPFARGSKVNVSNDKSAVVDDVNVTLRGASIAVIRYRISLFRPAKRTVSSNCELTANAPWSIRLADTTLGSHDCAFAKSLMYENASSTLQELGTSVSYRGTRGPFLRAGTSLLEFSTKLTALEPAE